MLSGNTRYLGRFFGWWLGELRASVPRVVREAAFGPEAGLEVALEAGEARFYQSGDGARDEIGRVALDPEAGGEDQVPALAREVRALLGGAARARQVTLLMPQAKVLRPKVELPAAAAENLAEVIAFEMDRFTPFAAEDVLFDFRVAGSDAEMERLSVEVLVARWRDVSAAIAACRRMGLDPDRVSAPGAWAGVNLLPPERRRNRGRALPRLVGAMAVVTLVLGGLALGMSYERKLQVLNVYEAKLATLRAETGAAGALRAQVQRLQKLADYLVTEKRTRPSAVELLNEATVRLPDANYLITFSLRKDSLQMAGYSGDPSGLLGLVEDSPLFSNARFAAPVTMDPRVGEERFNLVTTVARETNGEAKTGEAQK